MNLPLPARAPDASPAVANAMPTVAPSTASPAGPAGTAATVESRVRYTVYFEDTDSLGIVYYANYLKYLERGRTEYLAQVSGRDSRRWLDAGYGFIVHAMNIQFLRAAELGDVFEVVSSLERSSAYRGLFRQRIEREGQVILRADVQMVCVDRSRALREFPDVTATPA